MTTAWNYPAHPALNLNVKGRIQEADAARQQCTVAAILQKLQGQPGVILADEVGMGKTFVALAVAASVHLADGGRRPVVIMIPPALKEKWPGDFEVFKNNCLAGERLECGTANNALELLKYLDDEEPRRKSVVFLTHGALHRRLTDGFAKLAFIQRALKGRRNAEGIYNGLYKYAGDLLELATKTRRSPDVFEKLLKAPTEKWRRILVKAGVYGETDDDPIPQALQKALRELPGKELNMLYGILEERVPQRHSSGIQKRLSDARLAIRDAIAPLWKQCISRVNDTLPLLIMDEAHHLKNGATRLASLFESSEGKEDAEEARSGALGGVFERMLFLTATPFQLGHAELCNVLNRFEGIAWNAKTAPMPRATFTETVRALHTRLDSTQYEAKRFEECWSRLSTADITGDPEREPSAEEVAQWWQATLDGGDDKHQLLTGTYKDLRTKTREAETALRRYVVRHLKPRAMMRGGQAVARRARIVGQGMLEDAGDGSRHGLALRKDALLPFLLAARLSALNPTKRPVFAEGLSSSYEAFLSTTRKPKHSDDQATDGDDDGSAVTEAPTDARAKWYRDYLEKLISAELAHGAPHAKIDAVAQRAVELWKQGEKVLIFCHYKATGKKMRAEISARLRAHIQAVAAKRMQCRTDEVMSKLADIGDRFERKESKWRKQLDAEMDDLLGGYPALEPHREAVRKVIRRYFKTPSFLLRFFPLEHLHDEDAKADIIRLAFEQQDGSEQSLRQMVCGFLDFLRERPEARGPYLDALDRTQPGSILSKDVRDSLSGAADVEDPDADMILANIRLVNGETAPEQRQRVMRTFNTPFYPDILVASNVMAEGVDLHLACRHVIHHDLCWNPSTLEQRTGRVDRIGAKMEQCGRPIQVVLPYIGETQDEKMYRVVTDREKWFNILMGEKYPNDLSTTEAIARRLPLPDTIVAALSFDLSVKA